MTNCPHCGVSLIGAAIPAEYLDWYGGATHYRREIGIEVQGEYDGTLFYQCPDCSGQWHRWAVGTRLRAVAAKHMTTPQEDAA